MKHRGCALSYTVRGEGPPVLFIQGVGVHGEGWRPQVDALAARFQCLTFDNRGMGQSQPVGAEVTVEQMAEDALAIMDAQGWTSAHVVGHSLGGPVALQLALSARSRVRSLALLCTFADGRRVAPLTARMLWVGVRTQIGTRAMRRRAFLEMLLPKEAMRGVDRDALAANLAPLFGHDLGEQPAVVKLQLRAMRKYEATPRLAELAGLPTLVVSGTHDLIAPPRLGRVIADAIGGARFVEVTDAAHGLPIHLPERTNRLLEEHWQACELAAARGGRPTA